MSVKVINGFVPPRSGYQQIKTGAAQSAQRSSQFASGVVSTNPAAAKALSDAVVTSVKGKRGALASEKIREYREAKEVSNEVAEKIRETDEGVEVHDGLESFSGRAQLAN